MSKSSGLAEFEFSQKVVISRLKNGQWIKQTVAASGERSPRTYLKPQEAASLLDEAGFRLESEEVALAEHAVQKLSDQMKLPFGSATDTHPNNGESSSPKKKSPKEKSPGTNRVGKSKTTRKKKTAEPAK